MIINPEQILNTALAFAGFMLLTAILWVPHFYRPVVSAWMISRCNQIADEMIKMAPSCHSEDVTSVAHEDPDFDLLVLSIRILPLYANRTIRTMSQESDIVKKEFGDAVSFVLNGVHAIKRYPKMMTMVFSALLVSAVGQWAFTPLAWYSMEEKKIKTVLPIYLLSAMAYATYKQLQAPDRGTVDAGSSYETIQRHMDKMGLLVN